MSQISKGDLVIVVRECCRVNGKTIIGVVSKVHDIIPNPPNEHGYVCGTCGRPFEGQRMVILTLPCPIGDHTHNWEWPMPYVKKIEPPAQTVSADKKEPVCTE